MLRHYAFLANAQQQLLSRITSCKCNIQASSVRHIRVYERPKLYSLRKRREVEKNLYPDRTPAPRHSYLDWDYNAELFAFGKRLNEDFNDLILRQAFTEKSFVVKELNKQEQVGMDTKDVDLKDNIYLALEGAIILRNAVQTFLSRELPLVPRAGIESICDHLLSDATLAYVSLHIGTKDLILCDEYPPSDSTLANTFRAIVSALEKSSGKERAEKFVVDVVVSQLAGKDINEIWDIKKPWTLLTSIMTEKGEICEPRLIRESGRNSVTSVFIIGVYTSKKELLGSGIGETLEIAQEMAARDALKGLFGTRDSKPSLKFS